MSRPKRQFTYKNLTYKFAEFQGGNPGITLQDLIQQAVAKRTTVKERQLGTYDSVQRWLNFNEESNGMFFGELVDYADGYEPPAAETNFSKGYVTLSTIAPVDGTQFLHGVMYLAVFQNHVIFTQCLSMRSTHLQSYLNWLLRECNLITANQQFLFSDCTKNILAGSDAVKGIQFAAPVHLADKEEDGAEDRTEEVVDPPKSKTQILIRPFGVGWDVVKTLFLPETFKSQQFSLDDILANADLFVKLELTWDGRQTRNSSSAILDAIGSQLAHIDDEVDYTVQTKGGAEITKQQIKLKKKVSVEQDDKKLVVHSDMWIKMHEWLRELIATQKVTP